MRIWFGAVLFSTLNAYLLVPTVLSMVGPVPDVERKKDLRRKSFRLRKASLNDAQMLAIA